MKEEKRSNEWDKIERIRSHFKSPIFNIMLLIIVGLFVFGATFAYVHFFVPPAYAGEDNTFKVFDDGITYIIENKNGWLYQIEGFKILHEGEIYDCTPDGYHLNQFLSPVCVEIIMRSLP